MRNQLQIHLHKNKYNTESNPCQVYNHQIVNTGGLHKVKQSDVLFNIYYRFLIADTKDDNAASVEYRN